MPLDFKQFASKSLPSTTPFANAMLSFSFQTSVLYAVLLANYANAAPAVFPPGPIGQASPVVSVPSIISIPLSALSNEGMDSDTHHQPVRLRPHAQTGRVHGDAHSPFARARPAKPSSVSLWWFCSWERTRIGLEHM